MTNEAMARANIKKYERSTARTLSDVYKSFSDAKWFAYDYCLNLMDEYDGFDLRIISANTFIFTVGFRFIDPETGVVKFMYITPEHNTIVDYC